MKRCLESLIGQTYQNVEIILVDDGSTDRSGAVCDAYANVDGRIRVLHKPNGGVSTARNAGIDAASGEYLIFVDSDDAVHRELVEIYVTALELGGVPVCGVARAEEELVPSYLNKWKDTVQTADRAHFMSFLYGDHVNPPWNKLYEASIIRERHIRFEEGRNLGEDFLFNLQYFFHAPTEYNIIHCPLYYYQEGRENSLENSYHPRLFELQIEMFEALREFLDRTGAWNKENEALYYPLFWDRLYMTMNIYRNHAVCAEDPELSDKMRTYLRHPIWKELDQKCVYHGRKAFKHWAKKMNLEIWKRK